MRHLYAVVTGEHITQAITLGRTDYDYPPYNRAVRHNLAGNAVLIEGLFDNSEVAWLEEHGTILRTGADARAYIAEHREEWEAADEE